MSVPRHEILERSRRWTAREARSFQDQIDFDLRSAEYRDGSWYRLNEQQRAEARIAHVRKLIARNQHAHILRQRLARMEKLHIQRCLLGYDWLMNNPDHELSPLYADRHKPPF